LPIGLLHPYALGSDLGCISDPQLDPQLTHQPLEPAPEVPAYAGTDFIITRDGRIAAVYLFFDKLP
jgi:hypothetical protein